MQIFIRAIIPILIPILLGLLLSIIERGNSQEIIRNLTKEHIVIRLPKVYLWIGYLEISFFAACILMTCFPNNTATAWVRIEFGFFALIGVVIVLKTQIWKIEIFRSKDYFLCRTLPYKTYKIPYSDCLSYKLGTNSLVLKTKKKTLRIDSHATNFEFLLTMLTQHKIKEIGS